MRKGNSAGKILVISVVILTAAASFFTVNFVRTRNKTRNFYAVAGKDEEPGVSQALPEAGKTGIVKDNLYPKPESSKGVIEIKEKMFISQINDVYLNAEDYLGKTIKLEGIFKMEQGYGKPYYFVIRYGPGCCGFDGNSGFEVAWAKEQANPYPAVDSWVEAAGVLKSYEEDGYTQYLYLDLSSLNVLNRRGEEFVMQ